MKKRTLVLGLAALLALAMVFTGCGSAADGAKGTDGDPGLTATGPIATTLAGVTKYFAEGNATVYLLGSITVDATHPLTIGAGKTLVVTSYTDLNARSVTAGSVGGITVESGGTLVIEDDASDAGGALYFRAGTTFTAAADATVTVTQTQTNFGILWFETGNEIANVATLTALGSKVIFVATAVPPAKVATGDTEGLGGEAANGLNNLDALALIREAARLEKAIAVPSSVAVNDVVTVVVYKSGEAGTGVTFTVAETTDSGNLFTVTSNVVKLTAQNETDAAIDAEVTVTLSKGSATRPVVVTLTVAFQPVLNTLSIGFTEGGGTAVGDIKITVSGLTTPIGSNTVDYKFSEGEIIAPAKGTDPEGTDMTSAVATGQNATLAGTGSGFVGEYITVYELTSANKVVNYKSVQITNNVVKAPTAYAVTLTSNGYAGGANINVSGTTLTAVLVDDLPAANAAFDAGTGTAITDDVSDPTESITVAGSYKLITQHTTSGAYVVHSADAVTVAAFAIADGTYTVAASSSVTAGQLHFSTPTLSYYDGEVKTYKINSVLDEGIATLLGSTGLATNDKFTLAIDEDEVSITEIELNAATPPAARVTIALTAAPAVTVKAAGAILAGVTVADDRTLTFETAGTGILNGNTLTVDGAGFTANANNITFPVGTVIDGATKTIDVGNGEVTFVASSILTLSEGAVLTAYATLTDDEPITLTAGETGTDDDVVLTNTLNSVATLDAGMLTLPSHGSNQATLQAKGAGAIVVGGATNSVTFTGATITAGGHADSGDPTLTGAGGLVAIGAGEGANGGSIELLKEGTIVTAGSGKVTVGTGLQIGGADTAITASEGGGTAGVTFAAAASTSTITQKTTEAEDIFTLGTAANGIVFAGLDSSPAVITLTASVGGSLPVVFSGVSVTVPASTANSTAGAILDISEKTSILLGTSTGSLKFQKGIASGSAGSGALKAAANAKITAKTEGNYTKLPASAGFGASLGTDSAASPGAVTDAIASANSSGEWTLVDLSSKLFASEASAEEAVEYAVIDYNTALVNG
jgi:hypothetical protein